MPADPEKYVLLTGSDLGDREAHLALAHSQIGMHIGAVLRTSDIVESAAWGFESETRFLNQAILVETDLPIEQVLEEILEIEKEIGRVRQETQWASRIIDIDILCGEELIYNSEKLSVPHRYLHLRHFALKPLCQIVPEWIHPLLKKSYCELMDEITATTVNS